MHSNHHIQPLTAVSSLQLLRAAVGLGFVSLIFCGLLYSVSATVLAQWLFPTQANGSLIEIEHQVVGSNLVAQPFQQQQYFYARPSAAEYSVMHMSGSNLAKSSQALAQQVTTRLNLIAERENIDKAMIPSDLVTASASGIDPEISLQAAHIQVQRVAAARGISEQQLEKIIQQQTIQPTFGMLGTPRVNVLRLNLALDHMS